jgi:hypothetical protein
MEEAAEEEVMMIDASGEAAKNLEEQLRFRSAKAHLEVSFTLTTLQNLKCNY